MLREWDACEWRDETVRFANIVLYMITLANRALHVINQAEWSIAQAGIIEHICRYLMRQLNPYHNL